MGEIRIVGLGKTCGYPYLVCKKIPVEKGDKTKSGRVIVIVISACMRDRSICRHICFSSLLYLLDFIYRLVS